MCSTKLSRQAALLNDTNNLYVYVFLEYQRMDVQTPKHLRGLDQASPSKN